ncbi:MAG TPA: UDP-N-acetylmuramoyl-L-alanyl-D-glutamate--2,6-diaminopimelate ligase, partial [Porticoccaceae bacterium]|nr:UDP-N-acetylmuramoyl-L-alanyl-D-glutamate--2,6-diaminopimelate ligase [Porticoccaceae bacterium]
KGLSENGMDYIPQAIELGTAAILVDFADINNASTYLSDQADRRLIPIVGVQSLRLSLSSIAGKFYDNPSHRLRLVAVTGTNGKTT